MIQKAVINSLFLREMKTRFGAHKLGYFWAIIEPAAIIIVFWVMFGFRMRQSLPGVDYPMFLMTGMVPFQFFSNTVTRSMNAFQSNMGLFNYRQVKPIDTIIARCTVEFLIYFMVFILFMIAGSALGYSASVENIPVLFFVFAEFTAFSLAMGLFCAVIGSFSDNFPKVIGLLMRPLFFSSGIFFAVQNVPEKFRWMLLLNPVLHFLEMIRSAHFAAFNSPFADHSYTLKWTLSFTIVSLWLYTRLQNRIIASS